MSALMTRKELLLVLKTNNFVSRYVYSNFEGSKSELLSDFRTLAYELAIRAFKEQEIFTRLEQRVWIQIYLCCETNTDLVTDRWSATQVHALFRMYERGCFNDLNSTQLKLNKMDTMYRILKFFSEFVRGNKAFLPR